MFKKYLPNDGGHSRRPRTTSNVVIQNATGDKTNKQYLLNSNRSKKSVKRRMVTIVSPLWESSFFHSKNREISIRWTESLAHKHKLNQQQKRKVGLPSLPESIRAKNYAICTGQMFHSSHGDYFHELFFRTTNLLFLKKNADLCQNRGT